MAALIPLIEAGFVDWIVSTGANLYHDTHFGLGLAMHAGMQRVRRRIARGGRGPDLRHLFDYEVLLSTDAFFRQIVQAPEFQHAMSSAEFHYRCGKYVRERERTLGLESSRCCPRRCGGRAGLHLIAGDSSIGMNVAALALNGNACVIDPNLDVNETAAIVLDAKRGGRMNAAEAGGGAARTGARGSAKGNASKGKANSEGAGGAGQSAVLILGGGSPKNFVLQTEPQIQEVLGSRSSAGTITSCR